MRQLPIYPLIHHGNPLMIGIGVGFTIGIESGFDFDPESDTGTDS